MHLTRFLRFHGVLFGRQMNQLRWSITFFCALMALSVLSYYLYGKAVQTFQDGSSLMLRRSQVTKNSAGVPMILHFVYQDTNILEAYRSSMESCIKMNSDWTVMLWTDDSVRRFISREYPQYLSVFYGYPHKIQRSDAIRYLVLYRFGGVYLDLDMRCRQPLSALSSVPCFLDKEREHQTRVEHARPYAAMNSAMGCMPRHPFFKKVVDFVFHKDRLNGDFNFPKTIFVTTGPLVLTNHYDEWCASKSQPVVKLLNESYFSPKIVPDLYKLCKSVVRTLGKKRNDLSEKQKACLELQQLGYEKSDAAFITSVTVAIHEFTHLGWRDEALPRFDALRLHPNVQLYIKT